MRIKKIFSFAEQIENKNVVVQSSFVEEVLPEISARFRVTSTLRNIAFLGSLSNASGLRSAAQ